MKVQILIFLIIFSQFINCVRDKNPIDPSNIYSSKYFPLKVGNTWYYDSPSPQTHPWAMRTISNSFQIDNINYYGWTYGEGVDHIDSLRADKEGRIWKYIEGDDYLWFDFTQDSGSTYIYDYPDIWGEDEVYYYQVHVRKNVTCETPAGVFENCIQLNFNMAEVMDVDKGYTFAPDIGLVRFINNGWSDQKLTSAEINGSKIGN